MREQTADLASGIRIAYETIGDPAHPPLILIMGLGAQLIAWPDELCDALADEGYFVVRFDNRDVGLSSHLADLGTPSPAAVLFGRSRPPYGIEDMADDTASLLEVMGIASAHVVGASMGGFIAQTVALRHPDRVRSLSLLMTSTGSRLVGRPRLRVAGRLLRRRPAVDRESAVEGVVGALRLIASPGYGFEEARLRDVAGRSYDRAYDPAGYFRQLAAVSAQSDRTRSLRRVAVPTVVLHGLADPLVSVSGGRAIARAMQGARFVGFPGMGHDLPRPLWPRFAAEISAVATRGEAQRSGNR